MARGYFKPTYIRQYKTGLVQSRPEFLLPNDAFPVLENMLVYREKLIRKSGCKLVGRLKRTVDATGINTLNLLTGLEATASLVPGSINIVGAGGTTWTDPNSDGVLFRDTPGPNGTVNYSTGAITGQGLPLSGGTFEYYPGLPVMGLRSRELNNINFEQLIAFDEVYAYRFNSPGGWEEFIPGTTWTGNNSDFFWSTNYWVGDGNQKIFWVTNFSGTTGDPIRYTNGTAWIDFAPQIDVAGNRLNQCLAMVPFRSRMVTFNTFEGMNLATSVNFRQRIRWSAIGNPFSDASSVVSTVNANAWRDDIPGQGGFLDIPTAQNIVGIGFVRDNLVVYCERSTWQLRYTGRSIAPFQIEKVNAELGAESTFSAVQFDSSLMGIGDKGVVNCDSYTSETIDIKIPNLVFRFKNTENGHKRVQGIRDFQQRIAFWTYVSPDSDTDVIFPNRRLVYNYENDSWAIFRDSYTALGVFQSSNSLAWDDFPATDPTNTWENQNYSWIIRPAEFPAIVGGNQQGFVEQFGQYEFEAFSTNDVSLSIMGITGNTTTATIITSDAHNLQTGDVIEIIGIPSGTPFDNLNDGIFGIVKVDADNFKLFTYSSITGQFSIPQLDDPDVYIGGGLITIRDNFRVVSKKFNFLDDGQSIELGYMDILLNNTSNGAITMKVYSNYNMTEPVNTYPQNNYLNQPDTFFNSVIPTSVPVYRGSSKNMQRIYCTARGAFITLEFTFSNAQMAGVEQQQDVQIENQIIWTRPAGRQLTTF